MLLSEGINRVKAYAMPIGVSSDGQANQLTGATIVKWYSTYNDKLHQVYVNGRFAGVTTQANQSKLIVPIPLSQQTAARIEVFAVELADAYKDYSFDIEQQSGRVKLEFARSDNLPLNGSVDYYLGEEKLNKSGIKIQSELSDKGGFGLNSFGSDFGYDGCGAIGFGKGNFGLGLFGFDNDMLCWQSQQLETGSYKFNIKIRDEPGNEQITETETLTVISTAKPASELKIELFDKQNGKLILEAIGD